MGLVEFKWSFLAPVSSLYNYILAAVNKIFAQRRNPGLCSTQAPEIGEKKKTNDVDNQKPANQDMEPSLPASPFALVFTHLNMSLKGTLHR